MGKSLNGKELGKGIAQREEGLYRTQFINRFGKRQTIYAKTVAEITNKLCGGQYHDDKQINAVDASMTLNEWLDKWLDCVDFSREKCATHEVLHLPGYG